MPKKKTPRYAASQELDQIDETYRNLSGGKKKNKKKKSGGNHRVVTIIIILAAILLVCVGALFGFHYFSEVFAPETIPENVTIAGVNVGGLEREEATSVVTQAVENYYADKEMIVTIGDHQVIIGPGAIGAAVDVEALLDTAFALAESEDPAASTEIDLAPYLSVNEYTISTGLQAFAEHYPTEVVEHTWEVVDETVSAETPAEGEEAATPEKKQKLVITMGRSAYAMDLNAICEAVVGQIYKGEFTYTTTLPLLEPQPLDLDAIYTQYCTQAVDALMDPETFEVSDHVYGFAFNLESAKEAVALAKEGDVLEFQFEVLAPSVTKESLTGLLFRDVLSSYTARAGSNPNRNVNLKLSCEAVNGLILYPGDVFNYNKTLGQRTEAKGYKPAASYVGNETVDTVGGGICQTSSSIYYCVLLADLEVVQRANHAFISSYMPFGMDATVDWNGPNFRFRNNTNYPIKIEAKASGGNVTIRILGTDEKDYYVKMKYEVVEKTPWETQYKEIKVSQNKDGYKDGQVLTSAYTGYEIKTYKYKYNKETDELISKTLQTHDKYAKRDKVVVKLIDDTVPPPTTVPPTTAAPTPDPVPSDPATTDPAPTPESSAPAPESTPEPSDPAPAPDEGSTE